MNDVARHNLCELLKYYGRGLLGDPGRLVQLLRDCCGDRTREWWALAAAVEIGVPQSISQWDGTTHWGAFSAPLVYRLQAEKGLGGNEATWAVQSWGAALGACWEDNFEVAAPAVASPPSSYSTVEEGSNQTGGASWLGRALMLALCFATGGLAVGTIWLIVKGVDPGPDLSIGANAANETERKGASRGTSDSPPPWPDQREAVRRLQAELQQAKGKLEEAKTNLAGSQREVEQKAKEVAEGEAKVRSLESKLMTAKTDADAARRTAREEGDRRQEAINARGLAERRFEKIRDALKSCKAHVVIHNPTSTESDVKLRWRNWEGEWDDWKRYTIQGKNRARFEQVGAIDLEIEFDRIAGNGKYDPYVKTLVDFDRYPAGQQLSVKHGRHYHFAIDKKSVVHLYEGTP